MFSQHRQSIIHLIFHVVHTLPTSPLSPANFKNPANDWLFTFKKWMPVQLQKIKDLTKGEDIRNEQSMGSNWMDLKVYSSFNDSPRTKNNPAKLPESGI